MITYDFGDQMIQEFLDTYKEYVSWRQPKSVLKCTIKLGEEAGEVAEAVLACQGNTRKKQKIAETNQTPLERLEEELADVIIVALNIAYTKSIDLDHMFEEATKKMRNKIETRKHETASGRSQSTKATS